MTNKRPLQLYIDNDVIEAIKTKDINISQKVEGFLKSLIKIDLNILDKTSINIDNEIQKHMVEVQKLTSLKDQKKEMEFQNQEEQMVVDNAIDNMIEYKENLEDIDEIRIKGLQFLFKKKFNKQITFLEVKELLMNRIKERNIINKPTIEEKFNEHFKEDENGYNV